MALFKKRAMKKLTKSQNEYKTKYFNVKKQQGKLRSALTYAQWLKAGKPKPTLYTTATKAKSKKLKIGGLAKRDLAKFRD